MRLSAPTHTRSQLALAVAVILLLVAPAAQAEVRTPDDNELRKHIAQKLQKISHSTVDQIDFLAKMQNPDLAAMQWKYRFEAVIEFQNGAIVFVDPIRDSPTALTTSTTESESASIAYPTIKPGTQLVVGGLIFTEYQSGQWVSEIKFDDKFPYEVLLLIDDTFVGAPKYVGTPEFDQNLQGTQTEYTNLLRIAEDAAVAVRMNHNAKAVEQTYHAFRLASNFEDYTRSYSNNITNRARFWGDKSADDPPSPDEIRGLREFLENGARAENAACKIGVTAQELTPSERATLDEYRTAAGKIATNADKRLDSLNTALSAARKTNNQNEVHRIEASIASVSEIKNKMLQEVKERFLTSVELLDASRTCASDAQLTSMVNEQVNKYRTILKTPKNQEIVEEQERRSKELLITMTDRLNTAKRLREKLEADAQEKAAQAKRIEPFVENTPKFVEAAKEFLSSPRRTVYDVTVKNAQ